jgi:hypothetical protein
MRHHASVNQLVLWPRHEISEAWAPTGIVHPRLMSATISSEEAGMACTEEESSDCDANRGAGSAGLASDTILTRNGGICEQVGRGTSRTKRLRRPCGRARRRAPMVDMV